MMRSRSVTFLFTFLLTVKCVMSQQTAYGPGYQTIMMTNPAFAGSESDGMLRLSYFNFYPGQNYNLHSFYASYDSFFPVLHGGAAGFVSNDYLGGAVDDVRGGLSYAYHLQAGKNLFINGGLSASFFHRGFNPNRMVFPDQIDPLGGVVYQTSEPMEIRGRTVFDVGAGILLIAGKYFAAVAVNHLTAPDLSPGSATGGKLGREVIINLSGLYSLGRQHRMNLRPVLYGDIQDTRIMLGAGGVLETGIISVNAMVLTNKAKDIDLQTGLFFHHGFISFFYNYSINLHSGNNLLPASLVHNAGMVFSLKNVDKRKVVKTINFPKS